MKNISSSHHHISMIIFHHIPPFYLKSHSFCKRFTLFSQIMKEQYMVDLRLYFIYISTILEEFLLEEISASGCSELAIFGRVWSVGCILRFLLTIITATAAITTMAATTHPAAMPTIAPVLRPGYITKQGIVAQKCDCVLGHWTESDLITQSLLLRQFA
jgi:hypothetical protein